MQLASYVALSRGEDHIRRILRIASKVALVPAQKVISPHRLGCILRLLDVISTSAATPSSQDTAGSKLDPACNTRKDYFRNEWV